VVHTHLSEFKSDFKKKLIKKETVYYLDTKNSIGTSLFLVSKACKSGHGLKNHRKLASKITTRTSLAMPRVPNCVGLKLKFRM